MAKIKVTAIVQAKTKINEWKASGASLDQLIYHPDDLDGKDIQLWAFKQNVLVNIQTSTGPFMEVVFVSILI